VTSSGALSRPIVYTAYGTGNMPEFTNTISDVIIITNSQFVVIDNIKITDRTMNSTDHSVVAKIAYAIILANSSHCSVTNCEITLVGIAISVQPGSDFTTISGNNIHNLRAVRNTVGGNDDYGANAIVLATSFNLISNNIFRDCWATSYDYGYDGGAIEFFGQTISDNKILYNTAIDCDGFMEVGSATYGISTNNLVAYNNILNCSQIACLHNNNSTFGINTNNLQFYNNVIVRTKRQFEPISSLFWFADPTRIDVVILKNNLIYVTTGEDIINPATDSLTVSHSNNIYRIIGGIDVGVTGVFKFGSLQTAPNALVTTHFLLLHSPVRRPVYFAEATFNFAFNSSAYRFSTRFSDLSSKAYNCCSSCLAAA
jgi:hypothetical protein